MALNKQEFLKRIAIAGGIFIMTTNSNALDFAQGKQDTPDLSDTYQNAKYDPKVLPPAPGIYDLGDVRRIEVEFPSDGLTLAGHIYLPAGKPPRGGHYPAVVIDAPGSSVKEITVPVYAIRLARAGYIVLGYDRRGYGASQGVPQQMDPAANTRDIRNATTYFLSRPDVDAERLALLGICMGGGLAIQAAAFDRRYHAVATIAGHYTVLRMTKSAMSHAEWTKMLKDSNAQRLDDFIAGGPRLAKANAAPGDAPTGALAVMPEAYDFYTSRQRLVGPRWRNEMTYETMENLASFDSIPAAELISPTPLLIVHGTVDPLSPGRYAKAVYDSAAEPKRLVWVDTTNHSQLYDREPYVTQASDALLSWFEHHLH